MVSQALRRRSWECLLSPSPLALWAVGPGVAFGRMLCLSSIRLMCVPHGVGHAAPVMHPPHDQADGGVGVPRLTSGALLIS